MESFLVKVIACDRVFYDGKCYQVTIPLEDGGKGIMAHHEKYGLFQSNRDNYGFFWKMVPGRKVSLEQDFVR